MSRKRILRGMRAEGGGLRGLYPHPSSVSHSPLIPTPSREPLVQILPADAEDARGLGLVTADGFERLAYVFGLKLRERGPTRAARARGRGGPDRFGQFARAD